MRSSIKAFINICSENLPIQEPIYEFGALQVPGQEGFADLRPFFPGKTYVGADMMEGPGVDIVQNVHAITLPDGCAGTVISCDTLEHVEYPRKAVSEFYRILKPGGICIITSVMDWDIHGYPYDYWRFTPEGFRSLLSPFQSAFVDWNGNEKKPHTVVGIAFKSVSSSSFLRMMQVCDKDWKSINDFPLSGKLLSPVVKCKKFAERVIGV